MTPSHPPRPPIDALPKHPSMETGTSAIKHPLEPPVQQGPPQKHVRSKAFPHGQSSPQQASMAASSAVDTSKPSTHARRVLQLSTCRHHLRLCRINGVRLGFDSIEVSSLTHALHNVRRRLVTNLEHFNPQPCLGCTCNNSTMSGGVCTRDSITF